MAIERTFTVDEANALLPSLAPLVTELQAAFQRTRGENASARRAVAGNGSAPLGFDLDVSRLLEAISALGVVVRDPDTGLCDFPSSRAGDPIFLCWRLGEERVVWWHPRDTGIAGRQPL